MTTGVALTVAGIVVANPLIAPHSDVQIPAIQLSAGTDPSGTGMLDAAFLNAIAPAPPESTSPISVFRQLLTSLAASVTSFGRSTLVDALVAGVATVAEPVLAAASSSCSGPAIDGRPNSVVAQCNAIDYTRSPGAKTVKCATARPVAGHRRTPSGGS